MTMTQFTNLKSFLKEAGLNPEHTSEAIRAEASNRKYFRVTLTNPGTGPTSVVLCAGLAAPYGDEDHFIKLSEFLRQAGLPAPRVLAVDRDQGRMLITDAGPTDLSDLLREANEATKERLLRQAIDLLIQLQRVSPPPVVVERVFDTTKLQAEMDYLFDAIHAICVTYDRPDPITFELRMFLKELCELIAKAEPRVFAHRDFHTRNIMARRDARTNEVELTLIDFQDARMGLPYYDLASLLYDPYAPLTLQDRQMGLTYFRAKSDAQLPGQGMYYAQALQRILKALGTYLFQVHQKNHAVYLPTIPVALQRIEEICQLGRFPDSLFLFTRALQREIYPALAGNVAAAT